MIPFIENVQKQRTPQRKKVYQWLLETGGGGGEARWRVTNGHGVSFQGDESVLKQNYDIAQHCEYTKPTKLYSLIQ